MIRSTRTTLLLSVAIAVGAAGIGALRPGLNATFGQVRAREDVYVLPPPEELKLATLGYDAAAADMIWAQLLVEYGRHWAEKRAFPDLEKYIDAILALDPANPTLYRFVDTLLVFRPPIGTEADARKARAYLERGTRERPYDRDVWLQYGQFVGFLAPSFLSSEDEKEQWRIDGSEAIVRATELGAHVDRAISATSVLSRAGRRAAALEYLERAHALTQDPASLAEIEARLTLLERDLAKSDPTESPARIAQRRTREARSRFVDGRWRSELPFVSRGEFLLLGPMPKPLACTGPQRHERAECATNWEDALIALVR
jgi:hypothetical protein